MKFKKVLLLTPFLTCLTLGGHCALAGLGSYLNGAGANNRALSGAGTAFAEDGMVMALNPAGVVTLPRDGWQVGSIFLTARQTTKVGTVDPATAPPGAFALAPGSREAEPDVPAEVGGIFPVPFGAVHRRVDDTTSIGLVVYGNGGININYKAFDNPDCPAGTPKQGYFCFGDTGSDIAQVFIAPTWSYQITPRFRVGISPELIYQTIEINGFQLFGPASSRPDKLSNNGHSNSFGYGIKLGASVDISSAVSAALVAQSKGHMQKHKEYAGLLPEQGNLDIPANIQLGLAWRASEALTLMVDFQRIYFSNVGAFGNPGNAAGRYGDDNGPGFGWDDLTALKTGIHYKVSSQLTLRLGYTDVLQEPLRRSEVVTNLLSTAVFDQRYNAGMSWQADQNNAFDIALNIVPKQTITGENPRFPGQKVTLSNELYSIDIGWRRLF